MMEKELTYVIVREHEAAGPDIFVVQASSPKQAFEKYWQASSWADASWETFKSELAVECEISSFDDQGGYIELHGLDHDDYKEIQTYPVSDNREYPKYL